MRLSGVESERVKNLIRFMIPLYGPAPLANRLASEACQLDGDFRRTFIEGYKDILSRSNDDSTRNLILRERRRLSLCFQRLKTWLKHIRRLGGTI